MSKLFECDPVIAPLAEAARVELREANLTTGVALPEGYIYVTSAHYPGGKNPWNGRDMGYEFSVQLLNMVTGHTPRGTGNTHEEAIANAVEAAKRGA